jgi:hypothetical protein
VLISRLATRLMDKIRQAAYRHLLYVAMLDIRDYYQHRCGPSRNPVVWYRQYHRSLLAGAIADWLHNLANASSHLQHGFPEESFWNEHASLCSRFPREEIKRYRRIFDEYLAGKKWP